MLLCAAAIVSCDKVNPQGITEAPPGGVSIKFANFGVGAPSVNFYANDTKMTAVGPTSSGVAYGGFGAGGYYTDIAPGNYTIQGREGDVAISSLPVTLEAGKHYTFYQSGFYNADTESADAFMVEDDFTDFDYSATYVRFVNAISNSSPMTLSALNEDTSVAKTAVAVGGAVAYESAGAFVALPPGTYDLSARVAGDTSAVITRKLLGFGPGVAYTITARGDITATSGSSAPYLDNTGNW